MNFLLDVLLYGAAVFAFVYFIYIQFFSGHERLRRLNKEQKKRPRFERREGEQGDRRKPGDGSPAGEEQRKQPRRDRDH